MNWIELNYGPQGVRSIPAFGPGGYELETLMRIRERGMTLLLAEQSAHIALKIADRAYILETGRVNYAGDAAALRSDPALRASYLGV